MKRKTIILTLCSSGVVMICGALLFAAGLSWKEGARSPAPRPDTIATSTFSGEMVRIEDKTAGYAVVVPRNWYLEKSAGSGMVVYPDYDATGKAAPGCKIEISVLANPGRESLGKWLDAYFHEDPTVDISETSRVATIIAGAPALVWDGALNSVSSTLAYVATGTDVYEIAPSFVEDGKSGREDADCGNPFRIVLTSLHFIR